MVPESKNEAQEGCAEGEITVTHGRYNNIWCRTGRVDAMTMTMKTKTWILITTEDLHTKQTEQISSQTIAFKLSKHFRVDHFCVNSRFQNEVSVHSHRPSWLVSRVGPCARDGIRKPRTRMHMSRSQTFGWLKGAPLCPKAVCRTNALLMLFFWL